MENGKHGVSIEEREREKKIPLYEKEKLICLVTFCGETIQIIIFKKEKIVQEMCRGKKRHGMVT